MRCWIVFGVGLVLGSTALQAHAQCMSSASSCFRCHETLATRPVLDGAAGASPWHRDHAFADLCTGCHAGHPEATDQQQAHAALREPLGDPSSTCAACHEGDVDAMARSYLTLSGSNTESPPSVGSRPQTPAPSPAPAGPASDAKAWSIAIGLAALLGLLAHRQLSLPRRIRPWLEAETWSPYVSGSLLGLVVACCAVFLERPLGVAGAFDKLAAYLGRWCFPQNHYYQYVMPPAITWQVWLVVGLLLGSWASSRLAHSVRARWLPDRGWIERFGPRRTKRLLIAFAGAVLVQFGADLAGGCTSGLAISGGAVLSPAAFLFMAAMFAAGIPTAWLCNRFGRGSRIGREP